MKFIEAGVPEQKITLLRHCWKPESIQYPATEGNSYLFLGRLVKEKGVSQLIEAWRILEERLGASCPKLSIAGSGPLESRFRSQAQGIQSITFTGFVCGEQKARLLASCRGLIAPSIWWEPLGLIVYEAFEFGRPVLAARSGGLAESITENHTGFLYEPTDPGALADAVTKLEEVGNEGRNRMGNAGREWLLSNASPAKWLDTFRSIATRVISASR
jgi:glycosyltransferase involved in cell wall biosynthesis